jgi:sugar/nucleoside kinase (ribokinase family)
MADRFLVIGDVVDDIVVVPNGPLRTDTDTPSTIRHVPGGSAANTAAWLAALGGTVDFVGVVGAADVDRHAAVLPGAHLTGSELPTGAIVVIVDGEHRTMLTSRGANAELDFDAVPDELIGDHVHLTGHSMASATDGGAAFARMIARSVAKGATVSVSPGSAGYIADLGPTAFLGVIAGATVLFASLAEGAALTGLSEPAAIVDALDFPVVVLTLGAEGVLLSGGHHVPAVAATVRDPTGAGDAFAAAFLLEWVGSGDGAAAARAGAVAAASAVELIGGRPPLP